MHYISIEMYSSTTSSHPLSEEMRLRGRLAAGGSTALLLQALPTWLDGESTGKLIHEKTRLPSGYVNRLLLKMAISS